MTERECPTCGPTTTEQHPRRQGVQRCANCKEWLEAKCEGLTPFRCNNPLCPVHGDRIDPSELDAARLVGDMAEAEVVELRAKVERVEALLPEFGLVAQHMIRRALKGDPR